MSRTAARSARPETLLIACSDVPATPELQSKLGESFLCVNAGNIAPAYSEAGGAIAAAIEYAVLALKVRNIIVCGHTHCDAMRALLHPEMLKDMPVVAKWLRHAEPAHSVVRHNVKDATDAALLEALVEENVVAQLDNLKTHPCVASRLRTGLLTLHGWVHDTETGRRG